MANKIPQTLLESRSSNTIKSYQSSFNKWRVWAEQFSEVNSLPAKDVHVALFLVNLIQNGSVYATIKNVFYAIKWFHNIGGLKDPCDSSLCKNLLEASKRISSQPTKKKQPFEIEDLQKIFDMCGGRSDSLLDLRNVCFILLSFAGFLRLSEASSLKKEHITFYETHMTVFIEKSKTDVYREGNRLYIACTGSSLCPVKMLQLYFEKGNIKDHEFIFRQVTYMKSTKDYKLRSANQPLGYSTMNEQLKRLVQKIGKDPRQFSLHSLRSGGASSAANNGVKNKLFKRHGCWKSETVKDGYVKDNIHALLSVSSSLGL